MAKVLDTDIGPQLTGAVHLRTLECGDEVVKLGLVWRVIENVLLAPRAGVRLQNRAGERRSIVDDQNSMVDRVVGGRR